MLTFSFDLGISSIGWSVISNNQESSSQIIVDCGVCLINKSEDRTGNSLNEIRRRFRQSRRQLIRKQRRNIKLKNALKRLDLLPKSEEKFINLCKHSNPYALRNRALTNSLSKHEFGRLLLSLSKRRGYNHSILATSKSDKEWSSRLENGKLTDEPTIGVKLHNRFKDSKPTKNIIRYGENNSLTNDGILLTREQVKEEFDILCELQKKHISILTESVINDLKRIIFFQRPLKSQKSNVGFCFYEPKCKKAHKMSFVAQEFLLRERLSNMMIGNSDGSYRHLTDEERNSLFDELNNKKEKKINDIIKFLGLSNEENWIKTEEEKIKGNISNVFVEKFFSKELSKDQRELLINDLLFIKEETGLINRLINYWGVSDIEKSKKIITYFLKNSEKTYCSLSQKAMRKMTPYLKQGKNVRQSEKELYNKVRLTKSKNRFEIINKIFPTLKNPVVIRQLSMFRKLLKVMTEKFGEPNKVVIERTKELIGNKKEKEKINRKNKELNEQAKMFLLDNNIAINKSNIDKFKLWKETNEVCVYTGKRIGFYDLFVDENKYQIDHIIPYSRCGVDSFANKILAPSFINLIKSNSTPYELWKDYNKIPQLWSYQDMINYINSCKQMGYSKKERFGKYNPDKIDFIGRNLSDTGYITKMAQQYVDKQGFKNCEVSFVSGQGIGMLRNTWKLNDIISDNEKKNRNDIRHHAIDAILIGLVERQHLNSLKTAGFWRNGNFIFDESKLRVPFNDIATLKKKIKEAINTCKVYKKADTRCRGKIHNDNDVKKDSTEAINLKNSRYSSFVTDIHSCIVGVDVENKLKITFVPMHEAYMLSLNRKKHDVYSSLTKVIMVIHKGDTLIIDGKECIVKCFSVTNDSIKYNDILCEIRKDYKDKNGNIKNKAFDATINVRDLLIKRKAIKISKNILGHTIYQHGI